MGSRSETDIAGVAAAIGDASRVKVLLALAEGRALMPSVLAAEAGVTNSTISGHLTKLLEAKLLTVEYDGRHRYYRLATLDVARALEELARIAQPLPVSSLRQSSRTKALLRARLCYDHLAGQLGVALMNALLQRHILAPATRADTAEADSTTTYKITKTGNQELRALGVEMDALEQRRPAIRYCIDWAEHRHHLAGALGAAITGRLFDLDWIRHGNARRVVKLTDHGMTGLNASFGVPLDWEDVSAAS